MKNTLGKMFQKRMESTTSEYLIIIPSSAASHSQNTAP